MSLFPRFLNVLRFILCAYVNKLKLEKLRKKIKCTYRDLLLSELITTIRSNTKPDKIRDVLQYFLGGG
jgi:hypothetical protein